MKRPDPARARILRDARSKAAVLEILDPDAPEEADECQTFSPLGASVGRWSLYAGGTRRGLDLSVPLAEGTGPGRFPLPLVGKERRLFALRLRDQVYFLAERRLPMAGGFNVRDLGGLVGADNRRVIWGSILRADDLQALTPDDQAYLAGLPLRTVLDFRLEQEAARFPDRLPPTVRRRLSRPILAGARNAGAASFSEEEADAFMTDIYRYLALAEKPLAVYRELFHLLQWEEDAQPLLFHCSAGKDRTGFAAALVLLSLGVPQETVLRDYLASRLCLTGKYPSSAGIFSVREIYLRTALEEIVRVHGSLGGYLENVLAVDQERMRRLYLERMPQAWKK
ncbi:MAG: tyrosine-protein phosphatase [Desulfovibrio sp.]|jgi:protein-tyrosine phosphatase|nr:tyrosine-protein phosphatase [Desulfovibrio sp.]